MTKLTALIEAAKAATPGSWMWPNVGSSDFVISGPDRLAIGHLDSPRTAEFVALANPATILELCALLEQAEWTLEAMVENCEEPPEANCSCHVAPPCSDCVEFSYLREVFSDSKEVLTAIKQWKEQT